MDIITFGSATWDTFLEIKKNKKDIVGKKICFSLGSKINVDNIYFSAGGGGINTAITFINQGFKTLYYGKIGKDLSGQTILEEFKKGGIDTNFIFQIDEDKTDCSVVFAIPKQDRTILTYRGASQLLKLNDINFEKIKKAKWFYLAPLSKNLTSLFIPLVNFAFENKIKIAVNPGIDQLNLQQKILRELIKKIDILILNKEEASILTKTSYQDEKKILEKLDKLSKGIKIMTKGTGGLVVLDNEFIYSAGTLKSKVVERTGAGDAFGSGFVSGYIKYNGDIEKSIQLGSANATACLKEYGAQKGLLKGGGDYEKIKVSKIKKQSFLIR